MLAYVANWLNHYGDKWKWWHFLPLQISELLCYHRCTIYSFIFVPKILNYCSKCTFMDCPGMWRPFVWPYDKLCQICWLQRLALENWQIGKVYFSFSFWFQSNASSFLVDELMIIIILFCLGTEICHWLQFSFRLYFGCVEFWMEPHQQCSYQDWLYPGSTYGSINDTLMEIEAMDPKASLSPGLFYFSTWKTLFLIVFILFAAFFQIFCNQQ